MSFSAFLLADLTCRVVGKWEIQNGGVWHSRLLNTGIYSMRHSWCEDSVLIKLNFKSWSVNLVSFRSASWSIKIAPALCLVIALCTANRVGEELQRVLMGCW